MNASIPANETVLESNVASISLRAPRRSKGQRWLSLGEFMVGAAIVIGHNVYHRVPNEVPILFAIALISFRLRDGGWGALGLRWPDSWRRTVLIALAAAA